MGARRPGGRTARTRDAVLRVTLAELGEQGFTGLSVERVAERSGVHKTTVYRRWGGRDGLLVDALHNASTDPWRPTDTGSLDDDLRALAREVIGAFGREDQADVSTAAVSAGFQSEHAASALRAFYDDRHERAAVVVTRAIERGELPAQTDPVEVVRATVAPLLYRMFISREPATMADADRAAAAALAAARAGALG